MIYQALSQKHIPDIAIQFHKQTPVKKMVEGKEEDVFCRYHLKVEDNTLMFSPKELSDEELTQTQLKRAALGAIFVGHLDKLLGSSIFFQIFPLLYLNISRFLGQPKTVLSRLVVSCCHTAQK